MVKLNFYTFRYESQNPGFRFSFDNSRFCSSVRYSYHPDIAGGFNWFLERSLGPFSHYMQFLPGSGVLPGRVAGPGPVTGAGEPRHHQHHNHPQLQQGAPRIKRSQSFATGRDAEDYKRCL